MQNKIVEYYNHKLGHLAQSPEHPEIWILFFTEWYWCFYESDCTFFRPCEIFEYHKNQFDAICKTYLNSLKL